MGSLLSFILSSFTQLILVSVLVIYFHCVFYISETIALTDTKIMGAKHGIRCCRTLQKWKVLLPSKVRTLTNASILCKFTCYILCGNHSNITWRYMWNPLIPRWDIMVVHLWKHYLCLLRNGGYPPHDIYESIICISLTRMTW